MRALKGERKKESRDLSGEMRGDGCEGERIRESGGCRMDVGGLMCRFSNNEGIKGFLSSLLLLLLSSSGHGMPAVLRVVCSLAGFPVWLFCLVVAMARSVWLKCAGWLERGAIFEFGLGWEEGFFRSMIALHCVAFRVSM